MLKYLVPLLLALPASAEDIVTPQEFEAMTSGKTLYFSRAGQFYGAEQFYTRRRSLWQFADGECSHGEWYADRDYVCFVYEENPGPQCWHFLRTDGGFAARAEGAAAEFDIHLYEMNEEPLDCPGPDVGA